MLGLAACGRPAPIVERPAPAAVPPLLVATPVDGGLAILAIEPTKIHELGITPPVEAFGWADLQTLVGFTTDVRSSRELAEVYRAVGGEVVTTAYVEATELPRGDALSLHLSAMHEVYVARCITDEDDDGSGDACTQVDYLRIAEPRHVRTIAPRGLQPGRVSHVDELPTRVWPEPPTVAPPAGAVLIATTSEDQAGVVCRRDREHQRTVFPSAAFLESGVHEDIAAAHGRWVQRDPAIVEYTVDDPDVDPPARFYARGCEGEPFAGYAWFGDDRWASFVTDESELHGTWTFWRGTTVIGTHEGRANLRANR